MFDVAHHIEGVESLTKTMSAVNSDIKYKGGRFALRKAANLVSKAVKENALRIDDPNTAEQIAKNVAVRWSPKTFKRTGNLMFRVGILGGAAPSTSSDALRSRKRRRARGVKSLDELGEIVGKGKNNPGGDTWYWRLVEFGTRKTQAKPFMRPALEKNSPAAISEFVKHAKKSIERTVKKASKGKA